MRIPRANRKGGATEVSPPGVPAPACELISGNGCLTRPLGTHNPHLKRRSDEHRHPERIIVSERSVVPGQTYWLITAGLVFLFAALVGHAQDTEGITGFLGEHARSERQLETNFRKIPDAAHAENSLRRLTSEPHMAGTESSHRVAEWLRDQYRSFGFDS